MDLDYYFLNHDNSTLPHANKFCLYHICKNQSIHTRNWRIHNFGHSWPQHPKGVNFRLRVGGYYKPHVNLSSNIYYSIILSFSSKLLNEICVYDETLWAITFKFNKVDCKNAWKGRKLNSNPQLRLPMLQRGSPLIGVTDIGGSDLRSNFGFWSFPPFITINSSMGGWLISSPLLAELPIPNIHSPNLGASTLRPLGLLRFWRNKNNCL